MAKAAKKAAPKKSAQKRVTPKKIAKATKTAPKKTAKKIAKKPTQNFYIGSMADPHSPHVLMVEELRKKAGVPDGDFKSECGLSLRGMHAICPFKDVKDLEKQKIAGS